MSKSPLDLSKFRKVSSDEHTSTFEHYAGHQLTIAHSKLSQKMRDQLDSLPESKRKAPKEDKPKMFAEGGTVNSSEANPSPDDPDFLAKMEAPAPAGIPAAAEQAASQAPVQAPAPSLAPAPVAQSPMPQGMDNSMDPYGMGANTQAQIGALGEERRGSQMAEKARGAMGTAQAEQESAYQKNNQSLLTDYQKHLSEIQGKSDALQNDIQNAHVDPQRYVHNMSTGGKISTAIGLILGGAGAGLTHGPNMAFQYLQKQIENDIDSQKDEIGKKQSLLSHNLQEQGNLRSAYDLTRINSNDLLASHLRQEASKAQNPIAQGNLLQIAGKFDAQSAEMKQRLAMQKAMMGGGGQDQEGQFKNRMQYLRMNGQDTMAKDMEAKHVPGVGQASKEVPADVMKELIGRNDLQHQVQNLRQWAKAHEGSLDPATVSYGDALASQVQDAYRRANGQGVFKESEAHFVKGIVADNPTAFLNKFRVDPKYAALEHSNGATLNSLKRGYGLPATEEQETPETKTMGGFQYQKVPGGWKRVQ